MLIRQLHVRALRRFEATEVVLAPGFNLITGDNGSGKTSLLEAVHLMAHGRSFRGRVRDGLIRSGDSALQVFLEWQDASGGVHRSGLQHSGSGWEARVDGRSIGHLGELCQALAVVTFEPGSHALVDGSAEVRRRYLDWGLFHVEHAFLQVWRRYSRALKQRNGLLRQRRSNGELDAWEHELALAGEMLDQFRQQYVQRLQPHFEGVVAALLPAAGLAGLELQSGWRRQELALADALLLARERDLAQGFTSVGPHRADLRIQLQDLPGRDGLSRGQAKLTALALLLAQAQQLAEQTGEWPILQLDDLASELDRRHQGNLLAWLQATPAQVLVTGTEAPPVLAQAGIRTRMFHVEHGAVAAVE